MTMYGILEDHFKILYRQLIGWGKSGPVGRLSQIVQEQGEGGLEWSHCSGNEEKQVDLREI